MLACLLLLLHLRLHSPFPQWLENVLICKYAMNTNCEIHTFFIHMPDITTHKLEHIISSSNTLLDGERSQKARRKCIPKEFFSDHPQSSWRFFHVSCSLCVNFVERHIVLLVIRNGSLYLLEDVGDGKGILLQERCRSGLGSSCSAGHVALKTECRIWLIGNKKGGTEV